ncbi:hypothetical protein FOCG_02227 [Fusarium oxysporum f. sp. radicis-lycopersici 26381]|nr:hypothetical protein FOCG_02227 [Fusarium oxysporum f. sp. radicis-lycopersici 26381]
MQLSTLLSLDRQPYNSCFVSFLHFHMPLDSKQQLYPLQRRLFFNPITFLLTSQLHKTSSNPIMSQHNPSLTHNQPVNPVTAAACMLQQPIVAAQHHRLKTSRVEQTTALQPRLTCFGPDKRQ